MPINRFHAFGGAGVFQHPKRTLAKSLCMMRISPIRGLKLIVGSFLMNPMNQYRAARAWRRFERLANIDPSCWLGANAWCLSYMQNKKPQITIGKDSVIRGVLRIEAGGEISIGEDSYIGDDCILDSASRIEVGSFTMLAHGIHIFDNDGHPLFWEARLEQSRAYRSGKAHLAPRLDMASVHIGNHVWIGFNSFISKGVTIGDRSVVAAHSVVTKDVPPDALVAGNPARVVRILTNIE